MLFFSPGGVVSNDSLGGRPLRVAFSFSRSATEQRSARPGEPGSFGLLNLAHKDESVIRTYWLEP